jgi:putative flippase GtrA
MKRFKLHPKLKQIELKKVLHFQVIAWLGTLVNLAVLWLMHGVLKVSVVLAGAIAIEVAIVHNFTWNYFITWKTRVKRTPKDYFLLLVKYNIVTASIDFVVNLGTLWILNKFFGVNYLLADLIGQLLGPLFKFFANEFIVFPQNEVEKRDQNIFQEEQEVK